jgi:hypothetical protein
MRLKRSDHHDLETTVRVRAPHPEVLRHMEKLLPWFTPLLVYRLDDEDWIRWHVPPSVAEDIGVSDGCSCCGTGALKTDDGFHVDTAWSETGWWLTENGYELPAYGVANCNTDTPQEEGKTK